MPLRPYQGTPGPSTPAQWTPSPGPRIIRLGEDEDDDTDVAMGEVPMPASQAARRRAEKQPAAGPSRRARARPSQTPAPSQVARRPSATPAPTAEDAASEGGASEFRWSAAKYFLTYSQIGDRPNEVLEAAIGLWSPSPTRWKAAEERHADGGRHWHVIALWDKPPRWRGANKLDVDGIHPNAKV